MIKIQDLQNKFVDGVYDKKKSAILKSIKNGKAPKEKLLDIYRNNLYGALTNALKITYPTICDFLKEDKFTEFCQEFIKENRSKSGNLDDYGEVFADFLTTKKEYFLSDLCRLEWLKHRSYLALDVENIDIEKLQNLDQEKLFDGKFDINPSCFLLASNYNIFSKRIQKQPLKRSAYFMVYRYDFEIFAEKISKEEFSFLNGVKNNLSLYEIYEKYKINIHKSLQKYLSNGVLSDFRLD